MSSESELHQITLFTSDIKGGHPLDIHFKTGGPAVPVHSAKPPLLVATILPSCRFGVRSPAKSNVENGAAFVVDMAKVKVPMAGLTSCKTSCIKLSQQADSFSMSFSDSFPFSVVFAEATASSF